MKQNVSLEMVVLGATGATGRQVVARALDGGHDVTALVRRTGTLTASPRLHEILWADVTDPAPVRAALVGADVVVSALGGAGKGPTSVCTAAIRTVVPAMQSAGVRRLIVVSAHGVLETHDRSLYSRAVWAGVAPRMQDKETMERVVTASALDWTIVRPPALKDGAATGAYATGEDLPIRLWHSIRRADLADFIVREAEVAHFLHGRPRIHR